MKSVMAATMLWAGATLAATAASAQATESLYPCTVRVVYSEELPFAPIDSWLVKATVEVTPQGGIPYVTTVQKGMSWQGPPPRRNQTFRAWCNPANPNDLHLVVSRHARSSY